MLLTLSTWQEVDEYLTRSTGILIPLGSTEQHGPNGLLGTDAICPQTIAAGVAEKIDVLVGPTLNLGMAQHHLGFAGTISLRPQTLIAVITDVVQSLTRHGFDHFYFLNGHGGNITPVTTAFNSLHAETSFGTAPKERLPFKCKLSNWYLSPGVRRVSRKRFGDAEGHHATPSEISLTYFAHPEAVKNVSMEPKIAPKGTIRDADDFRRQFPDGRMGSDPSLASIEAGKELYEAAVADVIADYQDFVAPETSNP
jgi:creatinine amidohydrolase